MLRKLFLLVVIFLGFIASTYAVEIKNTNIQFNISSSNWRFTIWTAWWKRLIFWFPSESSTSFSSINIDGTTKQRIWNWTNKIFSSNSNSATYIEDIWHIKLTQILQIVKWTSTSEYDNVQITYKLKNTDSISHSGWIRIYFDTMIDGNDAAPFRVWNTAVTTETEYIWNDIPDYFQVFNSLTSPTLMWQWTVKNAWYYTPDRFLIWNYGRFVSTVWDYTASIWSDNWDSVIALYWNPKEILPWEEIIYTFVYWLSWVNGNYNPPLSFSISWPKELWVTWWGTVYSPDPFTVIAYVSNVTNWSTSHNTKVTLDLTNSPNLEIDPTDTLVKNLWDISYQNEIQVTWKVKPKIAPWNTDITQNYKILLESDDIIDNVSWLKTKELSRDIVLLNKLWSIDYVWWIADSIKSKYKNNPPKSPTSLKLEKNNNWINISWLDPQDEDQPYNIIIEKYINWASKWFLSSVDKWVQKYLDTNISEWNIYSYKVYTMNIWDLQSDNYLFGTIDYLNEPFVDIINPKISPVKNSQFLNIDYYIWWKLNVWDKLQIYLNDKLIYNTWAIIWNYSKLFWKLSETTNKLKILITDKNWNKYTTKYASKEIIFDTDTIRLNSKLDISFDSLYDNVIYKVKYIYWSSDYSNQIAKIKVYDKKTSKLVWEFNWNTGRENVLLKANYAWTRIIEAYTSLWNLIEKQEITINTKKLQKIELRYNKSTKWIDWSWDSIPEVEAYWFQCKDENWINLVNVGKLKDNSITTEIFKKSVICKVKAFVDWSWQYDSDEVIIWNIWKITKEMAYTDFMTIYWFKWDFDSEAKRLGIIDDFSKKGEKVEWVEYTELLFKIYAKQVFDDKKYDIISYNEFAKLLTEMIWIDDEKITKEEFEELKQYLKDNNDSFKKRVQNVFVYKDIITDFMNSWKSEEKKAILRAKIWEYFNVISK